MIVIIYRVITNDVKVALNIQIVLLVENNHKFGDASLLVLTLNIAPVE